MFEIETIYPAWAHKNMGITLDRNKMRGANRDRYACVSPPFSYYMYIIINFSYRNKSHKNAITHKGIFSNVFSVIYCYN